MALLGRRVKMGRNVGAAVSEWLIENNGQRFIVAVLTSGGSTDAGDRILMCAFHHFVQYATQKSGQRLSASNKRRRHVCCLCLLAC